MNSTAGFHQSKTSLMSNRKLKPGVTALNFNSLSTNNIRDLMPLTTSKAYKRNIKITSERGSSVYSLHRKSDGSIAEFKAFDSERLHQRVNKKVDVKDDKNDYGRYPEDRSPQKKSMPTIRNSQHRNSIKVINTEFIADKSNFFSLVSQLLKKEKDDIEHAKLKEAEEAKYKPGGLRVLKEVNLVKEKSHINNNLNFLKLDDKKTILDYEHEILGNYSDFESSLYLITKS